MNQKEKLKLFWKITDLINKTYCSGKLAIKDIRFFNDPKRFGYDHYKIHKDSRGRVIGYPCKGHYDLKRNIIFILDNKKDLNTTCSIAHIINFLHELAHAQQIQLRGQHYQKKFANHKHISKKTYHRIMHDYEWDKICKDYWTIFDKHASIGVKR